MKSAVRVRKCRGPAKISRATAPTATPIAMNPTMASRFGGRFGAVRPRSEPDLLAGAPVVEIGDGPQSELSFGLTVPGCRNRRAAAGGGLPATVHLRRSGSRTAVRP